MKKIRVFFSGIVLVAAVLVGSSSVSAQALDGAWFKLSISVKGYTVGAGEVVSKASFKTTSYLYLIWDGGSRHTGGLGSLDRKQGFISEKLLWFMPQPVSAELC